MNLDGIKFFFDSEFRDKYIHDNNFWLIMIGMSIAILIIFRRDWVMKNRNYKILLMISIGFCIIGNVFGFWIYESETAFGALNGLIISLLSYRFLYNWFEKKFDKIPASPFDTFWSNDKGLMKDGVLNFAYLMFSFFSVALFSLWTKG